MYLSLSRAKITGWAISGTGLILCSLLLILVIDSDSRRVEKGGEGQGRGLGHLPSSVMELL